MCPVPGVIGAVVAVEAVVACILQIFCGALGLCHVTPDLDIILSGQRALTEALGLGEHAVAQGDGEILAAGLFDGLHDLHGEAVAVFKGAAVFVRALVDVQQCELVQKIAFMHGVNLNTVHAGVL